jgi:hypothetical protein
MITTKRGTVGRATYSFDSYYGFQKALKVPKYMNAREQAQYYYDGIKNRNIDNGNDISGLPDKWKVSVPPTVLDVLEGRNTTDHEMFDEILRTAPVAHYQLTASGGSETVKYAVSGEYLNQDGIILNTNFRRYSVRANIDAQLTKKLAVKVSLNPSLSDSKRVNSTGGSGSANEGVIAQATNVQPYYPFFNADGSYFIFLAGMDAGPSGYNPVALAREITNNQQISRLLGNISARYSIIDNLNLNILVGHQFRVAKICSSGQTCLFFSASLLPGVMEHPWVITGSQNIH